MARHGDLDGVPSSPEPACMNIGEALQRFVSHLGAERNLAPRTIAAYRYDLDRLVVHLGEGAIGRNVATVESYQLKDYLATLQEDSNLKPATLCRIISSMKVFFRWAESEGYLDVSPAARLRSPRKPRKLPVYLVPEDSSRLLARAEPDAAMAARDQTMVKVLIMMGLRLSELVGIDVADVDFEQGTIRVLGKGRKERLVPMNGVVRRALGAWLASRGKPVEGCRALFLDRHGNRITGRMVQYALRKAVKELGLDPRVSPHKLRHTFATTLYAEETDLRDIQELLGHANIASTSIYTHTNVDKVRAAVEKLKM